MYGSRQTSQRLAGWTTSIANTNTEELEPSRLISPHSINVQTARTLLAQGVRVPSCLVIFLIWQLSSFHHLPSSVLSHHF